MKRWDLLARPDKNAAATSPVYSLPRIAGYLTPRAYRDLDTIFPLTRSILTDNIVTILLAV
jgi:hypothetical protein